MDQHDIEPGRVVLIADDDAGLRVMIRAALEQDGWTVEEAQDGLSACAAFESVHPDVVLLDVSMPRLDGFEACAQLRTLPGGDHVPVLMITGMDDEDSVSRAYEVGATDFLSKPFNFKILLQRLHYMYRAKMAATELQAERDFASAVVDTAGALVLVLDAEGRILRFNRACQLASGYALEEVKHRHAWEILSDEASADTNRLLLEKLIADKETVHYEGTLRAKDGSTRAVTWSNALLTNDKGEVQNVVCTGLDVTDINEAKERARFLTSYDPLTGLPNRQLIGDRIDQAISASEARNCGQLAVLFIDLDRFKDINATLGRSAGDAVIRSVVERLTQSLRLSDVLSRSATSLRGELGRLGGDQFTVLVTGVVGANDVAGIIERLQRTFHRPFKIEGVDYSVTASFGATLCPTDGNEAESLLRNAESAMYAAREQQRGTYHFYSPSMHKGVSERVTLESELRLAIDRGQLVLHYQPKVAADTRRITGAEALVRWQHPSRGLIPAADFVHIAEESGLVVSLGEWVIRAASEQIANWQEAGTRPLPVSVNVSSAQFRTDSLLGTVISVLNESSLDPTYLALEITESVIMRDAHEATQILERLRELGIHTTIDDFGTGYSTLSALKDLRVNTLKLDRAFVRDLPESREDKEIVKAVIAMAHGLGLTVAAEGVESDDQAACLTQVRCDELQGTLFGPPVPAEAFSATIREQDDRHETLERVR
jgi:diguanylate cyclase (GGDEF)-like protein/PAS domain S-box-containing protein